MNRHTLKIQPTISFFSSLIAITLAVVYAILRAGFSNNIFLILKVLGISLFVNLLPTTFVEHQSSARRTLTQIVSLLIIVILGSLTFRMSNFIRLSSFFFIFLGGIAFLVASANFFKALPFKIGLLLVVVFIFFSLWLSGLVWGIGFQNPLFIESLITGKAHIDILFHTSITQMIKTYGVPSTGLNHLPYLYYHWGSHWIFAQFSNFLNIHPLVFYQLGYPVIFISLFFNSFLSFVLTIIKLFHFPQPQLYHLFFFFFVLTVCLIPLNVFEGPLNLSIFFSESYLLSITFSFIFLSLIIAYVGKTDAVFFFIPLLLAIIGIIKISTATILFVTLLYLFIKKGLFHQKKFLFLFLASTVLFFLVYHFTNSQINREFTRISFFHFVKTYVRSAWQVPFFLYNFIFVFVYLILRFKNLAITNFCQLKNAYLQNKILDVELLVVVSGAGYLLGNISSIGGGSAIYFIDLPRWIGMAFMLAAVSPLNSTVLGKFLKTTLIVSIVILCLKNFQFSFSKLITENIFLRYIIIKKISPDFSGYHLKTQLSLRQVESLKKTLGEIIVRPGNSFVKNPRSKILLSLFSLYDNIPHPEKQATLLYVPKSNRSYWSLIPSDFTLAPCASTPFLAPALSGMAMINGLPSPTCQIPVKAWGYWGYDLTKQTAIKKIDKKLYFLP